MEYTENKILPERALLVALDTGEYDAESSLDELWELAKSGGAEPVATLTQKRPRPKRRRASAAAWCRRSAPSARTTRSS